MTDIVTHAGSCHCAAIKFTFKAPARMTMTRCNCSICRSCAFLHIFIDQKDVTLLSGDTVLTSYRFGTRSAQHMFCPICGIKPLYRPRSHPNSYSINYRCIRPGTLTISEIIDFDGVNWDQNIASLTSRI